MRKKLVTKVTALAIFAMVALLLPVAVGASEKAPGIDGGELGVSTGGDSCGVQLPRTKSPPCMYGFEPSEWGYNCYGGEECPWVALCDFVGEEWATCKPYYYQECNGCASDQYC